MTEAASGGGFEKAVEAAREIMFSDMRDELSSDYQAQQCVRAVLMAVREPDEAIIDAGHSGIDFHEVLPLENERWQTEAAFQAMIDAILAQGEGK